MISLSALEADRILAVPLAFKNKLRIEDKAYHLLSARERLHEFVLAGAGAGAGGGVAASTAVAGTFFAPTGLAAWLGLATATTPIGWVITAAVVTGGTAVYLGKLFSDKSTVANVVPLHINSPIDLLAQSLMELIGGLAVRVATIDGEFHEAEARAIGEVFHSEWGYDREYIAKAIAALINQVSEKSVVDLAIRLHEFLDLNEDCNIVEMNKDLIEFVREIVGADGVIRPSEATALMDVEEMIGRRSSKIRLFGQSSSPRA